MAVQAIPVELGWLKRVIFSEKDNAQIDSARQQGNCVARKVGVAAVSVGPAVNRLSCLRELTLNLLWHSAALNQARQELGKVRRQAAALQGHAEMNSDLARHVDAVLRSPQVGRDPISYQPSDLASDHLKSGATLKAATTAAAARLASCVLYHVQDTYAKLDQDVQ